MEVEDFWELSQFSNCEKGRRGIGYGYRKFIRQRAVKIKKGKVLRQIRKYGFDFSETWNLDMTILRWLSDNFGGFFKNYCGEPDSWYGRGFSDEDIELGDKRHGSFRLHLKDFLDSLGKEDFKKVSDFCVPRLRVLAKTTNGCPSSFPKKPGKSEFESWKSAINEMADKFEEGTYSDDFINLFFHLWD